MFAVNPGVPGWRVFARLGVPLVVRVRVAFDDEAGVYHVVRSDLRGLHVEAATMDEMQREVRAAASELLHAESSSHVGGDAQIIMQSAVPCAA